MGFFYWGKILKKFIPLFLLLSLFSNIVHADPIVRKKISETIEYRLKHTTTFHLPILPDFLWVYHARPVDRYFGDPAQLFQIRNIQIIPDNAVIENSPTGLGSWWIWKFEPPDSLDYTIISQFVIPTVDRWLDTIDLTITWEQIDQIPASIHEDDYETYSLFYEGQVIPDLFVQKAMGVRNSTTNVIDAIIEFTTWIVSETEYTVGYSYPFNDLNAISEHMAGDCGTRFSILYALCKTAGIPIRLAWGFNVCNALGLFDGRNSWNHHAWAEIYLPEIGWTEVEPASTTPFFINNTYIRNDTRCQSFVVWYWMDGEWSVCQDYTNNVWVYDTRDLNTDEYINYPDFLILVNNWLSNGSNVGDINSDGIVNLTDFSILAKELSKYSGGSGAPDDPYLIVDANDLVAMGENIEDYDRHFKLVNDIDLAGHIFDKAVIAWDTDNTDRYFNGNSFRNVFDGNGHIIENLTIDTGGAGNDHLGLFGCLEEEAIIKDLGIENCSIIAGNDSYFVGGLCGCNWNSTISNCYSTGNILGGNNSDSVGGLCGINTGTISNCYSTCSVSEYYFIGGLCGYNWNGTIEDCFSTGNVSGYSYLGALCGYNNAGLINNSLWDRQTQMNGVSVGVGYNDNGTVTNIFGKTTSQMQDTNTFLNLGWDFISEENNGTDNIWRLCTGSTEYPALAWQSTTGDFICSDGVGLSDFIFFLSYWLETDCINSNNCSATDLDESGSVNLNDFVIFTQYWLENN